MRYTLEDCQKTAQEKGGLCLSKKYTNNEKRLLWKCKEGHKWYKCYKRIKEGMWCPKCHSPRHKTQNSLTDIIKEIYKSCIVYQNYKQFSWLRTGTYGLQELDIYIKDPISTFSLAIEYDGEQHFKVVKFGRQSLKEAKKKLLKTQELDELKNRKVKEHPRDVKYFIRFNYQEKITKENVLNKLKENNIPIPDISA